MDKLSQDRLKPFEIFDFTYKTVSNVPVEASVLIPKRVTAGKHPVIVRFHGGLLVTGSRLFLGYLHQWVLDVSVAHSVILVTVDHRLIPEANGFDVLDDIADFWRWFQTELPGKIAGLGKDIEVDIDDLLVYGESAGGYLAIQSTLLHSDIKPKAVVAAYPMIDLKAPHYTQNYEKMIRGQPNLSPDILANYLASLQPGRVVPGDFDVPLSRLPIALSIVQQGRLWELLIRNASDKQDTDLFLPLKMLEKIETRDLPFILAYHGLQDSVVPTDETRAFEKRLGELHPNAKAKFVYEDGDHSFDGTATLDTPWLKEALTEVGKYWPAN